MNRQQQLDQFSLALHRQAIAALQRQPGLRDQALATLSRWRQLAGPTRSDPLLEEWACLLESDFAALECAALAESDHGQQLRSVSPLGALVSQQDRKHLLQQARDPVVVQ